MFLRKAQMRFRRTYNYKFNTGGTSEYDLSIRSGYNNQDDNSAVTMIKCVKILLIVLSLSNLHAQVNEDDSIKHYKVLVDESELFVKVFKTGIASVLADNHLVEALNFDGEIIFDKNNPNSSSIKLRMYTKSLSADDPDIRKKHGLEVLSTDDVKEINKHMLGADQLNVEKYPEISFQSHHVKYVDSAGYEIIGIFNLHGVTHEVKFIAHITLDGNKLFSSGILRFKQSEYGIEPYSIALGTIKNKDEIELNFSIIAVNDQ